MTMDLEVIELLPAREELAYFNIGNITVIGAVVQGNANLQGGLLNVNHQSNSVSINS